MGNLSGFITLDKFLLLCNVILALVAILVNAREAAKGVRQFQYLRAVAACLAFIYFIAYGLLLFDVVDRVDWSRTMIGVSLPAWALLWIITPLRSKQVQRKIVKSGVTQIHVERDRRRGAARGAA